MCEDFVGSVSAVKVAEKSRHCLDEERIGVAAKLTAAVPLDGGQPKTSKTTLDALGVRPFGGIHLGTLPGLFD